ncbi:MAG TPA: sulfite exporter TauE/SafE family protein [Bacteroidales bacterium]|nr:sulfite exporter TauE/SafE family protein [Bacteroidales bacterium]
MSTSMLLILIGIGILTGFMAGMLGIGGAIIMIPAMVFFLGFSQHTAQGTSLAVMLPPIGLIAAYNYYKAGEVNFKFAIILAIFFIVGSYFGSKVALTIPQPILKKIFGVLLLLVAVKMLFSK